MKEALRRNLLWVDGLAGAVVGILVLTTAGWLSRWYAIPVGFLLLMGWVNLAYGTYSLSLALRSRRRSVWILLLVLGNLAWAGACLRWTMMASQTATVFGLIHLGGEGFFVGGLACLEWRWRDSLATE